jgi:two-component system sensor histidine kinase RegB
LLGLGFLAAGTAHELNTPLTTMRLLVDEWRAAPERPPDVRDLELFSVQIERCVAHVRALAATAKKGHENPTVHPAADFVAATVRDWRALRPSVDVELAVAEMADPRTLAIDATLPQAIANLLNNAADAAAASATPRVRVEAEGSGDRLTLRILDRGNERGVRSDGAGLGIGLLISNATIERFGGRVRRFAREGGGSVTEVELPFLEARA